MVLAGSQHVCSRYHRRSRKHLLITNLQQVARWRSGFVPLDVCLLLFLVLDLLLCLGQSSVLVLFFFHPYRHGMCVASLSLVDELLRSGDSVIVQGNLVRGVARKADYCLAEEDCLAEEWICCKFASGFAPWALRKNLAVQALRNLDWAATRMVAMAIFFLEIS